MNGVFYITVKSHLIRFATVQLEFDKLFANLEANTITSSIAKTDSRLTQTAQGTIFYLVSDSKLTRV